MSRPGEYDPQDGGPAIPPNVYHPQGEASPVYEAYEDPATAHGWLNAYDETRELPPVPDVADGRRRHRGARRKPSGRRTRRGVVAAGAVGAVSAMAAAVALSFSGGPSGSPSDGVRGKDGRQSPAAGDTPGGSSAPATDRPSPGAPDPSTATSPDPVASTPASDDSARPPAAPTSATATPTPTAPPATTGHGNSGANQGHGQGATKRPK